jgi:VWFA-related protein
MHYRIPLIVLALLGALPSAAQPPEPILKSTSRAVQMEVSVNDTSGNPVHGLKKSDFTVTDDGRPREIRIYSGEIDANDKTPRPELTALPPGVYSNRFGLHDARIATAIVIDAMLRPDGLQKEAGRFAGLRPETNLKMALAQATAALYRMVPGEVMAIYAACPDLRIVQDFTSDPDQLHASLQAFAVPCVPNTANTRQARAIDAFVPPMLTALREVAGSMSSASGRKSVVWISQAYGTDLNPAAISDVTDAAAVAFNDANVPLYAVDARFNPTCQDPMQSQGNQVGMVPLTCTQEADESVWWMDNFARATGGRAFSGGNIEAYQQREQQGRVIYGYHRIDRSSALSDALLSAIDDSRYAYEMGFYVQDSELDGKVHLLGVKVPAKPKLSLRYRTSYTASEEAMAPPSEETRQNTGLPRIDLKGANQVGIDASVAKAGAELRVSLALDPATVGSTGDHLILLDETFTETDDSGKQLAKVQETVTVPSTTTPLDMIRYTRPVRLVKGAALLRVTIRDQGTNRIGTLAIPVGTL